jgi:hypothetical protein
MLLSHLSKKEVNEKASLLLFPLEATQTDQPLFQKSFSVSDVDTHTIHLRARINPSSLQIEFPVVRKTKNGMSWVPTGKWYPWNKLAEENSMAIKCPVSFFFRSPGASGGRRFAGSSIDKDTFSDTLVLVAEPGRLHRHSWRFDRRIHPRLRCHKIETTFQETKS